MSSNSKMDFCKMDIRPTLGGKNLFHDSSLPSQKSLTANASGRFFTEIVKPISVKGPPNAMDRVWEPKNTGRMSILQNSSEGL
jgi:hypothetical protein